MLFLRNKVIYTSNIRGDYLFRLTDPWIFRWRIKYLGRKLPAYAGWWIHTISLGSIFTKAITGHGSYLETHTSPAALPLLLCLGHKTSHGVAYCASRRWPILLNFSMTWQENSISHSADAGREVFYVFNAVFQPEGYWRSFLCHEQGRIDKMYSA